MHRISGHPLGVVTGMAPVDARHGGFRGNVLPPEPPPQNRRHNQQNAKQPEELIGQNEGYIGAKRQGDDAHLGEPPGRRAQKGAEQIGGGDDRKTDCDQAGGENRPCFLGITMAG